MLSYKRLPVTNVATYVLVLLIAGPVFAAEPPAESFWAMKESVSAVTFSPDGKQIVTAGGSLETGHLAFWNLDTMTRAARVADTGMVHAMLISPNGKAVFIYATEYLGDRKTRSRVRVFDVGSGKPVAEVETPAKSAGPTGIMALSPDGKLLALGQRDGPVTLHDAATGKVTGALDMKPGPWSIAFAPDGKTLAVGGPAPNALQLWDIATEKMTASLPIGPVSVTRVAYSPDGKMLVAGITNNDDVPGDIVVWDVAAGKIQQQWKGHSGPVVGVHFSRDGRFVASGARSSEIKLWDATTGKELLELTGPLNLSGVAFAPDGKTLAVSGGTGDVFISLGGVRLWDMPSGRERLHPKAAAERDHREAALQRTAAAQARARAARDRDPTLALDRIRRAEYALAIHVANEHAARWEFAQARAILDRLRPGPGQSDIRGLEWHLLDARMPRFTELSDSEEVWHAAFSPDRTRVAVGGRSSFRVFDVATEKPLFECKGFRIHTNHIVFSPDGKFIAAADDSANSLDSDVKLFDARTGKDVITLRDHRIGTQCLAFSPDGSRLVSGGNSGTAIVWDTNTWKQTHTFKRDWMIRKIAFSPDGKRLAVAVPFHPLCIRELETGDKIFVPGEQNRGLGVDGLLFLPDGKQLLAAIENENRWAVVEVETGKIVRTFSGQGCQEPVFSSELLAGWSLLNVASGEVLATFEQSAIPGRAPRNGYWLKARTVTPEGVVCMVVADETRVWLTTFPLGDGRRELKISADSLFGLAFTADGSNLLAGTHRDLHAPDDDSEGVN